VVPENNTLVQVGFLYPLNYAFVVSNSYSSAQIFDLLPQGVAAGLSLDLSDVTMHSLIPYDTTSTLGYITTISLFYVPTNLVSTLSSGLHTPVSPLYTNEKPLVNSLMNFINPAIPLTPGQYLPGVAGSGVATSAAPTATTDSTSNDGVFNTDQQNTSSTVKGTTAGIAVAAIGGAAAYGAAMFFLARRYKKKKAGHRRSSSLDTPSQMRYTGSPALMGAGMMSGGRGSTTMGGGRDSRGSGRTGNTARTAQISAPMMAENSLGWN
jgi:hypothetical protein